MQEDIKSLYRMRQNRLAEKFQSAGLDAMLLNPGASLEYLTGLKFHLSERPVVAIFQPNKPVIIIHAQLEAAKTSNLSFPCEAIDYDDDPQSWPKAFKHAIQRAILGEKAQIGIEPRSLRLLEYNLVQPAAAGASFLPAENCISSLRMIKDGIEIQAMQKAVNIAQSAMINTIPLIKVGMTERELASELTTQLYRAGSDPEIPFAPIVASGPNSANPHASPTDRQLSVGDLLVIDWGASHQGYFSDLTRTLAIGDVSLEYKKITAIVERANAAGRAQAKPRVSAASVDKSARNIIELSGYGSYFTHRTGHGLGMESHEEPYIRSGNQQLLEPGMVFTIEPGIYLPARNGSRIEDNVVTTEEGSYSMSNLPRELIAIE